MVTSRLARFQDLKCSITVCGCTVVPASASKLAHRRRPAQAFGAATKLSEDLLVGVALPDPGLKLGEFLRIDLGHRPEAALLGHAKNGRAS